MRDKARACEPRRRVGSSEGPLARTLESYSSPTLSHIELAILYTGALAWNLLTMGLLVRGAVIIGSLHHDDNLVFGLGVNGAYRIESSIARYPCWRPACAWTIHVTD